MADRIERLGKSLIQHGKSNDRVYLMKLKDADVPSVIEGIEALADRVLQAFFGKAGDGGGGRPLPGNSELREMNVADTPAMAAFYNNS